VDYSLLLRSDNPPSAKDRAMGEWRDWNPAAGFFHFSTKDEDFPASPEDSARRWRLYGPKSPMPSPTKQYRGRTTFALPAPKSGGAFPDVLHARRTWREFSAAAVDLVDLATVLKLTWGVERWGRVPGQGRIALKTSPSGGARHPGEVYVLSLRVNGLARGLYHYAADRHRLVRLRSGATRRDVSAYLPGQPWYGSAAVLLIMTAVFPREQWRYRFPRAYRAVLIDAGHLCQTFCLAATWLALAPFCSMAFPDSRVERDLGIDGISESALYIAGFGKPPRHGWKPWAPAKQA
jgi:SagB-type dehydrogenase family enzyme